MDLITVRFSDLQSHSDVVKVFDTLEDRSPSYLKVVLDFSGHEKVYSDYLLLIVAALDRLTRLGYRISYEVDKTSVNKDKLDYVSRVDFFKNLGIEYHEDFPRFRTVGRFTEIRSFDNNNALLLFNRMMSVLVHDEINIEMLAVLKYCLWEVIDNTLNHSGEGFTYGRGTGFGSIQYFPTHKEIRIIIADCGVGIHHALTRHPNSKYKDLSERDAVMASVQKGVTNSEGRGFGLWATAELIKHNQGKLQIHSGNSLLEVTDDQKVKEAPFWRGTYTTFKLNTEIAVSDKLIFGESSTILDRYIEELEDDKEDI